MLQPRRSSSQICCSREDHRLKYITTEKIVVSNTLQPKKCRRLIYVVTENVIV
uniref:Uncharacterized protein n=1 Tax=Cucumis melo TaxID=3656 RepID=A0A9I9EIL1_CUCME